MIRCYMGALLLALLLLLGICGGNCLTERRERVLSQAQLARDAAVQQDWPRARREAAAARETWERSRPINAVFSDHASLERIDDAFEGLEFSENPGDYSRLCGCLEALTREQKLSLENIF